MSRGLNGMLAPQAVAFLAVAMHRSLGWGLVFIFFNVTQHKFGGWVTSQIPVRWIFPIPTFLVQSEADLTFSPLMKVGFVSTLKVLWPSNWQGSSEGLRSSAVKGDAEFCTQPSDCISPHLV